MQLLPKAFASAILAIGLSFLTQPSEAEASDRFFCGTYDGEPATMIQTPQGSQPLIQYRTDIFGSNWSPSKRCREVTSKLNAAYQNNEDFLTVSRKRGYNIICSAKTANGDCEQQIITVPNGKNAASYLNTLRNRFYGRSSAVLISRPSIYTEYNGIPYWNIGEVVRYWESVK
ncbi:MAG: COP23 domain-containing protein [Microcystaceae cyanobacterium]